MSAITVTLAQGRNANLTGLVDADTGANHKVQVTRWVMTRSADVVDLSEFGSDDEKVGHGHHRSDILISGWVLDASAANPGIIALGGAGVSSTFTFATGRTIAGTVKSHQIQMRWVAKAKAFAILIRGKYHGTITETWS